MLVSDTVALVPTQESNAWLVQPAERFGVIERTTSESDLVRLLGPSTVQPSEIYLGEGFCTAGTRIFPDTIRRTRDWVVGQFTNATGFRAGA